MKFKVGDMVRLTREALINYAESIGFSQLKYYNGFQIIAIDGIKVFYGTCDWEFYVESELELVPEEPEFEYGEEIEVSDDGEDWNKRVLVCKIKGNAIFPYVCVADYSHDNFINGSIFSTRDRKYARKLRPQLTRKGIAEKFGVSEDFTLVD